LEAERQLACSLHAVDVRVSDENWSGEIRPNDASNAPVAGASTCTIASISATSPAFDFPFDQVARSAAAFMA